LTPPTRPEHQKCATVDNNRDLSEKASPGTMLFLIYGNELLCRGLPDIT